MEAKKSLFTPYADLQDLLFQPLKPLIHLVGFQSLHSQLLSLTFDSAATKDAKHFKSFAIQSYDFYDSGAPSQPAIYTQTSKTDKLRSQDLGFLKHSFFQSLVLFKPAVTILVFDWKDQVYDAAYDWKSYEAQVLAEVKQHQDKCPGSRQSKIVLLIFLPLNDTTSVDEKITSLKRAVAARGDDNIKTFFLLTTGLEGLKNIAKKFVKNVNDLCYTYYREKKFHIKKKQKRLIKEQIENIRYSFKHGIYSSYTKQDFQTPVKYLREAYTMLRQSIGNSGARTSFEEKRENADLISLKICQMLISHGDFKGFVEQHRQHFYTFQTKISLLRKEQRYEEIKWRANQMRIMAHFLELHPPPPTETSIEMFAGYYCLNCMILLIARRQEYLRLIREKGDGYLEENEMQALNPRTHNLIGKDWLMQDTRDPLGAQQKISNEQKALMEKYKVYIEGKTDLDPVILDYAQRAIQMYKGKSRSLKGNSQAMFRRLIHFITYHISEYVFAGQPQTAPQTQKYRSQIARSLIQEGWTQEALNFVEKAKQATPGQNIEEVFSYEMEILNYDRQLPSIDRQARFLNLISKVQQELFEDQKILQLAIPLVGVSLIWARASFDLKTIQVNHSNRLTLELFTKLEVPLKLNSLTLRFNDPGLNQVIPGPLSLNKTQPYSLNLDLLISKDSGPRDFIQLLDIVLNLQQPVTPSHQLQFIVKPYLMPRTDLLDMKEPSDSQKTQRSKEAIMFQLETMPSKVRFRIEPFANRDQALIGDPYQLFIYLEHDPDIEIQEMVMKIEGIESENVAQNNYNMNEMESQNLMASQMEDQQQLNHSIANSSIGAKPGIIQVKRQSSSGIVQKQNSFGRDILPNLKPQNSLPFVNRSSQLFKDIELFYSLTADPSDRTTFSSLTDLDTPSEVSLPANCRRLMLQSTFFTEAFHTLTVSFHYTFVQQVSGTTLKQSSKKQIKIRSQSPFRLDFQMKTSDAYLQNLKLRQESLQQVPLLSPNQEDSWLTCTFISQAVEKILYLDRVNLDILQRAKVKAEEAIDAGPARLAPGEAYEYSIKIRPEFQEEGRDKWEIELFAEMQFGWYSQISQDEVLIGMEEPDLILCSLPLPPLTVVEIPLKLTLTNEKQLQKALLYEPIGLDLEVYNKSENVIDAELTIEESDDFYIGGELKSYVQFMPYDRYTFKFNLIPLQIGRLSLPKLNISEIIEPERTLPLIKGFTKKCLIIK